MSLFETRMHSGFWLSFDFKIDVLIGSKEHNIVWMSAEVIEEVFNDESRSYENGIEELSNPLDGSPKDFRQIAVIII